MISATFKADFADFLQATERATTQLKKMGTEASAVGPALDKATSGAAPAGLDRLGDSANKSSSYIKGLYGSVKSFDDILDVVGVNLGPIPRAVQQLGEISGQTASELGGLATAGAAVGAALGGWQIGRWIADLTGSDKAIGDFTASLLGLGDVAAEETAAKMDTLARASVAAGREITSMDEAIKVLTQATFVPFSERLKLAEGEVGRLTAAQREEIAAAQELGLSTAEITKQFGVSEGALKLLNEQTREKVKADAEAAAEAKKLQAAQDALFGRDLITRASEYADALGDISNISKLTVEKKAELRKAVGEALDAYKALGETAPTYLKRIHDATFDLNAEIRKLHAQELPALTGLLGNLDTSITSFEESTRGMILSWKQFGGTTREELEAIAVKHEQVYAYVLSQADKFTPKQIENFRKIAEEARKSADNWGSAFETNLDAIDAHVDATGQRIAAQAMQATAAAQAVTEAWAAILGEAARPGTLLRPDEQSRIFHNTPRQGPTMGWVQQVQARPFDPYAYRSANIPSFSIQNLNVNAGLSSGPEVAQAIKDALTTDARMTGQRLGAAG